MVVDTIIKFFKTANSLKWIERRGWVAKVKVKVKERESVADHCYLTALMCMVLADLKELDSSKAVKIAMLHDLAESIVGDYMPEDISTVQKHEEEEEAIKSILSLLPSRLRLKYGRLWKEYRNRSSKEAILVHEVDKLEMALQASDYRLKGYAADLLSQFFDSADMHVKDKTLTRILNGLKQSAS